MLCGRTISSIRDGIWTPIEDVLRGIGMENVARSLKLVNGKQIYLTPGIHTNLQVAIIEKFGPRYAAGAIVLFLSDIINEPVIFERERLEQLGVPVTIYAMLADIILYQEEEKWLYLIRVGTSFRFLSHRRLHELERLLERCTAKLIYISAFPSFAEYLRYAIYIAWGSHVWIAEIPGHMIHYNGDYFLAK